MQAGQAGTAAEVHRFARCSVQPEALRRTPVCTLGCPVIDKLLNGGIPGGSITELVGESTVGKTQLCLQLLLTAQLPEAAGGLAGRSLYITTEGSAPLGRLKEIAAAFPQLSAPCDSVLIANASANPEQLLDAVRQAYALAGSAELSPPVRLVIIDSITNPFRELDASNAEEGAARSRLLYQIACTLKEAAHRYQLAVVLVNHIVDCVDDMPARALAMLEQATGGSALRTSGRRVMPALGLHWAHCVSTRLFLSRATPAGALQVGDAVTRRLRVVFAPHLPPGSVKFAVTVNGVRGVEEEPADTPHSPT